MFACYLFHASQTEALMMSHTFVDLLSSVSFSYIHTKRHKENLIPSNILKCHWLPLTPTLFHLPQNAAAPLESHRADDNNNSAPEFPRSDRQRPFWTSFWSLGLDWKRIRCNLMGWWAVNIPEARTAVLPREQLWWMAGVTTETYGNSKACRDVTLWM